MLAQIIVNGSWLIVHRLITIFLAFVFLLTIISYLLPITHAQAPAYAPVPSTVSPASPAFTDLILQNTFHSFSCLAIGSSIIGQPCLIYQITKTAQGAIQSVPVLSQTNLSGGALGATTSLIGALYMNPPIRTANYLASVGEGLGIVKTAHAQVIGSGAAVLDPILNLWKVSRNISYLIMIIIFVIIGLMVMFRQRINPQTVITAQAALPGLVIGLILITFSYFLAGLISDTAFIGTNLVGAYFSAAQGTTPINLINKTSNQSVLTIFSNFVDAIERGDVENAVSSILNSAGSNVQFWLKTFASLIAFQFGAQLGSGIPLYGPIISFITGGIAAFATAAWTSQILGWVFSFIAIAILIYTMLRLLLRLINNYINIIFLTITAPFQFLLASLPGRQGIASDWIRNMLCNVLAFPTVMAVFYFVSYLLGKTYGPFEISSTTNVSGSITFPLLGGLDLSFIRLLIVFGALVSTPAIPDIICRTIGKASQAGQLIGQQISGGVSGGRGYFNQFQGGVSGAGRSITQGLGGETTFRYDESLRKWVPYTGRPGLWGLIRQGKSTTPPPEEGTQ